MRGEEYTFVTLDGDEAMMSDAVVIDVDEGGDFADAVVIDDGLDNLDFITLSDETIMLSDTDMLDMYSTDIDGADISFMI